MDSINQEISIFINKEKVGFEEMDEGLSNNLLFIFRIFTNKNDSTDLCLSAGYIFQEYEFDYFTFNYFILHENDTIAVLCEADDVATICQWFDLKPVTPKINSFLKKRLYSGEGELSYQPPGLICCLSENEVKIEHYDFASEIPPNKSVYEVYLRGVTETYKNRENIEQQIKNDEKNKGQKRNQNRRRKIKK